MSRIVDIEPVITKLENTQKQNVHTFSKRELVDAIADIMNLKPIDAVSVVWCKLPHNTRIPNCPVFPITEGRMNDADSVAVVRCKDCKHSDTVPVCGEHYSFPLKCCLSVRYGGVFEDWFCEHGERR